VLCTYAEDEPFSFKASPTFIQRAPAWQTRCESASIAEVSRNWGMGVHPRTVDFRPVHLEADRILTARKFPSRLAPPEYDVTETSYLAAILTISLPATANVRRSKWYSYHHPQMQRLVVSFIHSIFKSNCCIDMKTRLVFSNPAVMEP
jgi:hypothetical protein